MSVLIRLAAPAQATPAAQRPNFFAGRSLSASDFELQDAYVDDRFAALRTATPGAIWGLGVSPDAANLTVTVAAGLGLGFSGPPIRLAVPLSVAWADLFANSFATTGATKMTDGLYLLLARPVDYDGLIGPPPDQALLSSGDPLLDLTQQSFVEIFLSAPLGAAPAGTDAAAHALAFNLFAGGLTWKTLAQDAQGGLPLAAVLLQTVNGAQNIIVNGAAGRLPAGPAPLDALLLAQSRQAIAEALLETGADPTSASWQNALRARFRYLPAAGELPGGLFSDSAPPAFFPKGMAVYLEFIRAGQAQKFLADAAGQPGLDFASGNAEAATLALAVPDALWSRDLIDHPRADPVLAADLHLAYARARAAQVAARAAWLALYGGLDANFSAQAQPLAFLMDADGAAQNVANLLDYYKLPGSDLTQVADAATTPSAVLNWAADKITKINQAITTATAAATAAAQAGGGANPPPAPAPPAPIPVASTDPMAQFYALGYQIADPEPASADPTVAGFAPPTSDSLLAPLDAYLPANSGFVSWTSAIQDASADPVVLQPLIDAGVFAAGAAPADRLAAIGALLALPADSTQPGALAALASLQLFYAILCRVAVAQERQLAAYDRMLALQRQHLDMTSVYVSGLAGGIPTDGSGLSVIRTIPFFKLTPATTATPSTAPAQAAPKATDMLMRNSAIDLQVSPASTGVNAALTRTLSASTTAAVAPQASLAGFKLGAGVDIAAQVAMETAGLSQAPQFTYQSVNYGAASYVTNGATILGLASTGITALQGLLGSQLYLPFSAVTAQDNAGADSENNSYANITLYARALLADMATVETQARTIESGYLLFRDRVQSLAARIDQATQAVASARDALRAALAQAATAAGDYAAAQQLAQQELARVTAAVAARAAAINAATGLFFRRELQTLASARAVNGLPLVGARADGLPDFGDVQPPAALQPFIALLQEAPLNDWPVLRGRWNELPDFPGLARLQTFRSARLANWTLPQPAVASAAAMDLSTLTQTLSANFTPVFSASWAALPSLAATQTAAFSVLAPPDLGILSLSDLRLQAEAQRARLESAAGALYAAVAALPTSTRFDLASRARNKTLPLLDFSQWPLPSTLDAPTAATARQLAALVGWISSQMDDQSSSAGRSAVANLVAATVMIAAFSDPNEAVSGAVTTTGAPPRVGWPLRGIISARPPVGSLLNLFDDNQALAGVLSVQDHDATGTTFSVVKSFTNSVPNGNWTILSQGRAPMESVMTLLAEDSVAIRRIFSRGIAEGDLRRRLAALPTPRVRKFVFVRRLTLRGAPEKLGSALQQALEGLAATAGEETVSYNDFPALAVACAEAALSGRLNAWHWRRLNIPAQAGPGAALAALLADYPLEAGAAVAALAAGGLLAPVWRDLDAAAAQRLLAAVSFATGFSAPDWPEREDGAQVFFAAEAEVESALTQRAANFWAAVLAPLPARAPARRAAAFLALLRWAPGLLRRPEAPAVGALMKIFAGPPAAKSADPPPEARALAADRFAEPPFAPSPADAREAESPAILTPPARQAGADAPGPAPAGPATVEDEASPPSAAEPRSEAHAETEASGEAIVTDWGGVFFLVNALRRLNIAARLEALGEEAPSGWRLLLDLGALFGLPGEEPLSLFFERQDFDARAPELLLDELAAGLESLYAPRGPWPFPARRLARLRADETHVDVDFLAETIDIDIRLAGLDLNPGWTPWLGRVVAFHYPKLPIFSGGGF